MLTSQSQEDSLIPQRPAHTAESVDDFLNRKRCNTALFVGMFFSAAAGVMLGGYLGARITARDLSSRIETSKQKPAIAMPCDNVRNLLPPDRSSIQSDSVSKNGKRTNKFTPK